MRIDKYLWCVRLYKTRSLAANEIRSNKVLVDGEVVKPSREISEGQEILLKKHGYDLSYKILGWPKSRVGAKLVEDYLVETTSKENLDKREFLQMARNISRQRGLGRPTKKERRDLDEMNLQSDL